MLPFKRWSLLILLVIIVTSMVSYGSPALYAQDASQSAGATTPGAEGTTATAPKTPLVTPTPTAEEIAAAEEAKKVTEEAKKAGDEVSEFNDEIVKLEGLGVFPPLSKFGSDFFTQPSQGFLPFQTPAPSTYSLGPGDKLNITFWTKTIEQKENPLPPMTIDNEGKIIIPLVGTMVVRGLTLDQFRRAIKDQLSKFYKDVEVVVTLTEIRRLQVFITGEAKSPGGYTVSSLSTAFNALLEARGASNRGSLRRIQLIRENKVVGEIDLYKYLMAGDKSQDYALESGDTLFVPIIGSQVAIYGEVKRPDVYELKGGERIKDIIDMAGGIKATGYLQRIQVRRVKSNQEPVVIDIDASGLYSKMAESQNIPVQDRDYIKVFRVSDIQGNWVTIKGDDAVVRPGRYELKPHMKVRDLVEQAEGFQTNVYLGRADILRTMPDFTQRTLSFDLKRAMEEESQNIELQKGDVLRIYSRAELRIEDEGSWKVRVLGQVKMPGTYAIEYSGEKVSHILERAGGITEDAYPQGAAFVRKSARIMIPEQRNIADSLVNLMNQISSAMYTGALLGQRLTNGSQKEGGGTQTEELISPRAVALSSPEFQRVAIDLKKIVSSKGQKGDLVLEDEDIIVIPRVPLTVYVGGAVNVQIAVMYEPNKKVDYYVERAGGYTKDADSSRTIVVKANGEVLPIRKISNIDRGDLIIAFTTYMIDKHISAWEKFKDVIKIVVDSATAAAVVRALNQ